jgi:CBS domain-containing protein
MRVSEIMTCEVVTVRPETPIHEAAALMASRGISGLPVVDGERRVVGILSEGDLIVRQKPRERLPWWRQFFADAEALAREYRKAVGTTAADVMTTEVLSIGPEAPVAAAAVILDEQRIRRLPVVASGRLVGIVSRGDLVRALARVAPSPAMALPDDEIVREMRERLRREPWATAPLGVVLEARNGILEMWGLVSTDVERSALETMARTVPGVRGIENHLVVRHEMPHVDYV